MIWINDPNGRHQHWGGTFKTKAEARAEERRLLQERDAGTDLKPVKLTVQEIFDQYIIEKRTKVKASSFQRTRELIANLAPLLGAIPVARLRPAEVSAAYDELLKRLSRRTVRHCHWQLHGALDLAVRWGQVGTNVAAKVTPPEPDAFEGRALTEEEIGRLITVLDRSPLAALIVTG